MQTLEAIHQRRSIRKFSDAPVGDEQVEALLRAAMSAPSAGNAQPWQFIVVRDRALLDKVPDINPYAAMCRQAPVSILICGDLSKEKYEGFWVQDCSAAIQNMLLAVRDMGLGAVWTGIHPVAERVAQYKELFGLPEHVIPLALVPVGHTDKPGEAKDRFDASRVHTDTWGGK